jgi:hypothetical protein
MGKLIIPLSHISTKGTYMRKIPAFLLLFLLSSNYCLGGEQIIKKENLANIAPYSEIATTPFCGTVQYLTDGEIPRAGGGEVAQTGPFLETAETQSDGNIANYAAFPLRASNPVIFFSFAKPADVRLIRFFQRKASTVKYRIDGDADGDGKFETLIFENPESAKPEAWESLPVTVDNLKALRFTSLEESPERGAPQIGEFEIYATNDSAKAVIDAYTQAYAPAEDIPVIRFSDYTPVPTPTDTPEELRYGFGATCSLWMWINQVAPYDQDCVNPNALYAMKDLTLDKVHLFAALKPISMENITLPTEAEYRGRIYPSDNTKTDRYAGIGSSCVPWPSEVLIGYKDNILKRFTKELASHGIGVTVIPPRNVPPFDVRSGFYPMAQSDTHDLKPDPRFPCVWHGGFFEKAFAKIIREITASSVSGVGVVPDEYYIEGHSLTKLPKDDPCRELFKLRFGIDIPAKAADTSEFRKWLLFQYESTANLIRKMAEAAKSENPGVKTETNLSVAPIEFYNAPNFSAAIDIIGHTAGIDLLGTDPYFRHDTLGHYQMPKTALLYQGATRTREVNMMLQAVCGDFRTPFTNPVWAAGTATSVLMRGVHSIDFYRLDYFANISDKDKQKPVYGFYRDWLRMIRSLEPLGLKQAKVPCDIALLHSRAGTDWWELREKAKTEMKTYPLQAMAGHAHLDAVMHDFFTTGRPFDLFYLDQPETLRKALEYKLLVLPFAYSVSREAASLLEEANAKGCRILLVKHLGETDEYGDAYPEPVLGGLKKLPGILHLDLDLLEKGNSLSLRQKLSEAADTLLGDSKSFTATSYGRDLEIGALVHPDGTWFIPMVNWSAQDAIVDIGVKCEPGMYQILRYCLQGTSEAAGTLSADELKKIRLKLNGYETAIVVIKQIIEKAALR